MPNLTAHFTWAEMRYDSAPVEYRPNLAALATLLERARALGGAGRVRVTSTYRSPLSNAIAGGVKTSQHLTGSAADLVPLDRDARQWFDDVADNLDPAAFGQMIYYAATSRHVHLSLPNRASGKVGEVLVEASPGRYVARNTGEAAADSSREGVATVLQMVVILFVSFAALTFIEGVL